MTKPSRIDPRHRGGRGVPDIVLPAGGALLAALLVLGCWPVASGAGGSGGAGGGGGTLSGTDLQVCAAGCQQLIDCGAELDLDACKADCASASSAGLVTCFRSVTAACDPLASCAFDSFCVSNGFGSGAPSGGSSCSDAGLCLLQCGGSVTQACACACGSQASSSVASPYYNLFVCAYRHCSIECGPSGDPGSCETCIGASCATEAQSCP